MGRVDEAAGPSDNLRQMVIPPGFLFHIALPGYFDVREHLDVFRTVATNHEQVMFRPILVGETLSVLPRVRSITPRGPYTEVVVEVDFSDEHMMLCCQQRTVFLERVKQGDEVVKKVSKNRSEIQQCSELDVDSPNSVSSSDGSMLVTRELILQFAGAVQDYNLMHVDVDSARQAGYQDIIAHGPLTMAWMGQMLMRWFDPRDIAALKIEFLQPTYPGDRLSCECERLREHNVVLGVPDGLSYRLIASNQEGKTLTRGIAIVRSLGKE